MAKIKLSVTIDENVIADVQKAQVSESRKNFSDTLEWLARKGINTIKKRKTN